MTRAVSGTLVALAHLLFVLALLRFAETPDARYADVPVDYVAVVFIPAPRPPVPAAAHRRRPRSRRRRCAGRIG